MQNETTNMAAVTPRDALVDIKDVAVDTALPKQERVADFVRQMKDPYHFLCGGCTMMARFTTDGPTLEDCLQRLLA